MFYLHLIHYIGFFGAQVFNSILAILIIKRAGKLFGSYRHVMLIFTVCSMWFSLVEILTQPVLQTPGSMIVCFMNHDYFSKSFGEFVLCLHCSSFVFLNSVFAAQFFYRYCALCRHRALKIFDGNRTFLVFTPCLMIYISFFNVTAWGTSETPDKQDHLKKFLNLDSTKIPLISMFYWKMEDGEKIWMFPDLMTLGISVFIITSVSLMIIYFALKIYFYMNNSCAHLSQRTLNLNKQLFIMLIVQTLIPFLLMYIPTGLVMSLPALGWSTGELVTCSSASLAVYPMCEPLAAMYCISDFREALRSDKVIRDC